MKLALAWIAAACSAAEATPDWELRTTPRYSHRLPKGWSVQPLELGPSFVEHELLASRRDQLQRGQWVTVGIVRGEPVRQEPCAERSYTTIMHTTFDVCRSAGPTFATSASGRVGGLGFTFWYDGVARGNPLVEEILSSFALAHP